MARRPTTKWLRLAQHSAVLMGVGALSAGTAQAMLKTQADGRTLRGTGVGVSLHLQGGRVYLTEHGRAPQELVLSGKEGEALKRLLETRSAAEPVRVTPMIVADGAGGVQWVRPRHSGESSGTNAVEPTRGSGSPGCEHKVGGSSNCEVPQPTQRRG